MSIADERGPVLVFGSTEKLTAPLPVPVWPEVTANQDVPSEADQPQPAPAVMATLPVPPLLVNEAVPGEIE